MIVYVPTIAKAEKQPHKRQNVPHLTLSNGKQLGAIKHHVW
jgi:hypothetical protein